MAKKKTSKKIGTIEADDVAGYVMILLTKDGQLLVTSKDVEDEVMADMVKQTMHMMGEGPESMSKDVHTGFTVH